MKKTSIYIILSALCLGIALSLEAQQPAAPIDNFVYLKGGKFPFSEANIPIELSPFYISPTEVTYGQMLAFVEDNRRFAQQAGREGWKAENYSYDAWGIDLRRAAVNVDWFDAIRYANWLSGQQGLEPAYHIVGAAGDTLSPEDKAYWEDADWERVHWQRTAKGYRLPTEAEWEYAASGYEALGYVQEYAGTNDREQLENYAWYDANAGSRARAVASLKPNPLGLYDMSGNVWEWCWDFYLGDEDLHLYQNQKNPFNKNNAKPYSSNACLRGASWYFNHFDCRVRNRSYSNARDGSDNYGFRLSRTP